MPNANERDKLYALSDSILQQKLNKKFPQILNGSVMKDSLKPSAALNESTYALTNDLNKN